MPSSEASRHLTLHQPKKRSRLARQLVVYSLHNPARFEHIDPVVLTDRAQPVCYHDPCRFQPRNALGYNMLSAIVERNATTRMSRRPQQLQKSTATEIS